LTPAELKDFASEKNKADAGNANGLYNLGVFYDNGHGVARNKAQAIVCWRKSAELGYAPAMYNLGYSAINAEGMSRDPAQGVAWYRKSADLGHVPAMCNLGICYADGVGVPVDLIEAAKWLGMAVKEGDASAAFRLGLMKSKLTNAIEALKGKAGRGDAKAQFSLAECYYNGFGVPQDDVQAVSWYRKSADQGFVEAQYMLGYVYAKGECVQKDEAEAFKLYRMAAEKGYHKAQVNLAVLYSGGQGVRKSEKDDVESYAWLLVASTSNVPAEAKRAKSGCSIIEESLSPIQIAAGKKRFEELQALIKKNTGQANKSIAPGTNAVVSASKTVAPTANTGTDSNDAKSIEDLRLKAERGDAKAQYKLAVCYVLGDGMPKNQIEANKWFKKAEAQGYTGQ
jgi:TPR repeat protein